MRSDHDPALAPRPPGLMQKFARYQSLRFILVGVLNTAFSYGMYAGFVFIGIDYKLANFFSLMLGILFSLKTQGHLVFKNTSNRLLGRFIIGWVAIYLCVIVFIGRLIALGLDAYSAGALALPVSVALSFVVQKFFVFRKSIPLQRGIQEGPGIDQ